MAAGFVRKHYGKIDLDVFARTASHLRRIHETLGLERKPADPINAIEFLQDKWAFEERAERAEEVARKALLDYVGMQETKGTVFPRDAAETTTGEGAISQPSRAHETALTAHGDSNLESSDTPNISNFPENSDTPSEIISVTDHEQIKRWDAERTAPKSNIHANSKTFANGFSWRKSFDPTINCDVYDLYNSSGVFCGTRKSRERADKWAENEGSVL